MEDDSWNFRFQRELFTPKLQELYLKNFMTYILSRTFFFQS